MVNVDGFKSYNDAFGHSAGDEVLCIIARQLVRSSRAGDVVTRYGGEEFAIVLPDTGTMASLSLAERQREAIESFRWPLKPVTASFGVATRTPSIADVALLVEGADRALYASKRGGRNRVAHLEGLDGNERPAFNPRRSLALSWPGYLSRAIASIPSETNDPSLPSFKETSGDVDREHNKPPGRRTERR